MKNTFCYVAVRTGLEPVTPCVTGMYSNQAELTHQYFKERAANETRRLLTLSSYCLCVSTHERQTRLELATPTLARSCSTN